VCALLAIPPGVPVDQSDELYILVPPLVRRPRLHRLPPRRSCFGGAHFKALLSSTSPEPADPFHRATWNAKDIGSFTIAKPLDVHEHHSLPLASGSLGCLPQLLGGENIRFVLKDYHRIQSLRDVPQVAQMGDD
jgi:hypothetical protein